MQYVRVLFAGITNNSTAPKCCGHSEAAAVTAAGETLESVTLETVTVAVGTGKGPPALLRDDTVCRLWYKHDALFNKPRANIRCVLSCTRAYETPLSSALR
jgi:Middle or third domain of peptidase_M16